MNQEHPPTILIVDDEHHNIHVLGGALRPFYRIQVATSGEQAQARLATQPLPDMVLLDIVMPGKDGFEVCLWMKENPATSGIPVIFITARDSEEDEIKGLGLGAVDFIAKPIRPAIVRARVQAHLQLVRAREEALAANRGKSTFLATMSHEIRTPLNGILGMAELLVELELPMAGREYAGAILNAGRGLLGIINDVLDYAKIEAAKMTLESIPFAPRPMLSDIAVMFRSLAERKGIGFALRVADSVPEWTLGDPNRLRQVLVNLLSNAVKFTHQGEVGLDVQVADGGIACEVRDTGVGIRPEQFDKLFCCFEQASSAVARQYGGTGLGLAICRQLVQLMGGRIEVESTPGVGSLFRVWLPLAGHAGSGEADGRLADADPGAPGPRQGARVLVVDDDPINQTLLRMMMKRYALRIEVANNGRQAVDLVTSRGFDLVFMDCQMPEMDGYAATRLIRKLEPADKRRTPIVALTGNAAPGEREKCLAAGMDEHLVKPVSVQALRLALRHWLMVAGEDGS
ncbi:MAG: response regulator [Magnetococcales bacterium]|nr:response regulator [Magnetococcales bacterium]